MSYSIDPSICFTLAQAAPGGSPGGGGGGLISLLPMVLLLAGFWFLIIAPQNKKRKLHEKMIQELKIGDEIVTAGGIYGKVTNVKDDRLIVRISDNAKIELAKSSVSTKVEGDSEKDEKSDK